MHQYKCSHGDILIVCMYSGKKTYKMKSSSPGSVYKEVQDDLDYPDFSTLLQLSKRFEVPLVFEEGYSRILCLRDTIQQVIKIIL